MNYTSTHKKWNFCWLNGGNRLSKESKRLYFFRQGNLFQDSKKPKKCNRSNTQMNNHTINWSFTCVQSTAHTLDSRVRRRQGGDGSLVCGDNMVRVDWKINSYWSFECISYWAKGMRQDCTKLYKHITVKPTWKMNTHVGNSQAVWTYLIVYNVRAHTHSWQKDTENTQSNIDAKKYITHRSNKSK